MPKGLFLSLAGVALFILIVGLITQASRGQRNVLSDFLANSNINFSRIIPTPTASSSIKEIHISNKIIEATVADTDAARNRGLSGVTNLPTNQGMLFVFQSKNIVPSFWMKGMLIPLDFIWIGKNQVMEITPNVPVPATGTPDNQLAIYKPGVAIDYVLEVNAGFVQRNGIIVGDAVTGL